MALSVVWAIIEREFPADDFLTVLVYVGIGCFAWKPIVAWFLTAALGSFGVVAFGSASYLMTLAFSFAIVTATCSRRWIGAYAALIAILTTFAAVTDTNLTAFGRVGIAGVALIAFLVGVAFRLAAARERVVEMERARAIRRLADLSREQQERVADELHDGIAHDLTIVLFHARALPLQTDDEGRDVSLGAITSSADRALTNIRSLLGVLRETDEVHRGDESLSYGERLSDVIDSLTAVLEGAGIPVREPIRAAMSKLPEAIGREFTGAAIEAVTNIMKHAPDSLAVDFAFATRDGDAELTVMNTVPSRRRAEASASGGSGLVRMRQRVQHLGGRLDAHDTVSGWVVHVILPMATHKI